MQQQGKCEKNKCWRPLFVWILHNFDKHPNEGRGITDYKAQLENWNKLANITQKDIESGVNFRIMQMENVVDYDIISTAKSHLC